MENEYYERLYNEELEIAASNYAKKMSVPYDEAYNIVKNVKIEPDEEIDIFEIDPLEVGKVYEEFDGRGYDWVMNNLGNQFVLFEKVTMQRIQLLIILCGFNEDNLLGFYGSCDTFNNLTNLSYYKRLQLDDDAISDLSGWGIRYVLNNQQLIAIKSQEFCDGDDSVNTHCFHLEKDLCKRKVLFEKYILRK